MELFEIENHPLVDEFFDLSEEVGDYVILFEEPTDLSSVEAEKSGLIKIHKIMRNAIDKYVELEVAELNYYKIKPGESCYYSYTNLWRLEYLMPAAYKKITGGEL